ncbi:MAG: UDP-3-O-(3-hydroxymyristoyl)glucosamine N-acyltransferase [Gemmatimonadetes bacterium]|nr:UDP-3-O-(3-hydroxymyristoyl)glucosamine N-acyltransferase [Gemmatimonadota bacterium]
MAASATLSLTAAEIAAAVDGVVSGDPSARVSSVAPLDRASTEDLSFLAHSKYADAFAASDAGVVLVTAELAEAPGKAAARVVVAKPYDALVALLPRFYAPAPFVPGVHSTAIVAPSATVGRDARIDAYAIVGEGASIGDRAWIGAHSVVNDGATVGADTRLFSHVVLYAGAAVGERTILHAGVRIGSDGFGYAYRDGAHRKIQHVGRCVIGNDVEIGANSAIDRGSIDDTVIGDGTKIDNLVHIAHNVRIGRLCLLMAQVGVAGSVRIEDGAILAGQVGVSGHLTIGKGATLAAQAGVFGDIPAGETWSGYPARPHRDALRAQAASFRLPALLKRIERMLSREPE